jgi:hypothetical protein
MGVGTKSPNKLEPEDRLSRIPNVLALVIYRVLPISSLSMMVYEIHKRYDAIDCTLSSSLSIPAVIGIIIGMHCFGRFQFEYTMEEAQFR